ncbi:hypothetical protein CDD80_2127 [Ophiocordyceps camponoti-rufipedis]|uniref:Uncharacterized protein n=1 Tax=Ophiocordyceps camponoti-rufipedis TaxID=2004952 RepID=A0A2C5ZJU8_9HYPO|nr:hypothetical protein CDD80_2127 [Ophiocordyceps camponoti-rufipedis]
MPRPGREEKKPLRHTWGLEMDGIANTSNNQGGGWVKQSTKARYLKRSSLQYLLEDKFPGYREFNLENVNDIWSFIVPRRLSDAEISSARDD